MKKFLIASLLFLFPAISYGSNCHFMSTVGSFDEDFVCELKVSEDDYNEIFELQLLEGEEFSFREANYRIVLDKNAKEGWIPIVDDLKVLAKDVKKAVKKTAMNTMGLSEREAACVLSVTGTIAQGFNLHRMCCSCNRDGWNYCWFMC